MFAAGQKQFRDCQTYEERIEWLHSEFGQRVLSNRPRIYEACKNGKIEFMLRDPKWVEQLNQWLRVPNNSRFDAFPPGNVPRPFLNSSSALQSEIYPLTEANKLDFLIQGYLVMPNIIPPDILQSAIEFMNNRQISDPGRPFISDFTMEPSILNLFYKTDVRLIADTLLYGTNPHPPIFIPQAQIAQRPPEDAVTSPPPSFGGVFGFGRQRLLNKPKEKNLSGRRWHIDGLAQGKHSPFSLLIGVALSDQLEEYSGNLCVFPGSHHSLQPFLKEFVSKGYLTHLEREGQVMGPNIIEEYPEKPLLDSPTQLLLGKGDVVIAHQKLAHRGGPNYSQNTRNMIYFRVASYRHLDVVDQCLENIWTDFDGMKDVL